MRWITLVLMLLATPALAQTDDAVLARWIQFGPNQTDPAKPAPVILARAITTAGCPTLAIDGHAAAMAARFTPDAPTDAFPMPVGVFPVSVCDAIVPPGHATATIGGVDLKLPVANPKRILVIADTGCRMAGPVQQDCQDPVAFPLAFLATYEASFKPDLIVHVGDYFYRDTGCLPNALGFACPNTHTQWGDNWASWSGDFFAPAKALLAEAPWVMTRGNHEGCGRGANGWYHLLDPRPFQPTAPGCKKGSDADFSPTYVVPAGAANLLVHDSSFANDQKIDTTAARRYATDLTHVLDVLGEHAAPSIFVTHKPTYGLIKDHPSSGDMTEQYLFNDLFAGVVPSQIALFLSGHIHQAEYVTFADAAKFAPQLVVGVGGSLLDAPVAPGSVRYDMTSDTPFTVVTGEGTTAAVPITGAHAQAEFGFAVLDATPTGFLANLYTINGQSSGRCVITLAPRNLQCTF